MTLRWLTFLACLLLAIPAFSQTEHAEPHEHLGFDRNSYPGDAAMQAARKRFSFVGYWLNNPPGASSNNWAGKRATLHGMGYGFLLLWNGKLDKEIRSAVKSGTTAAVLGAQDGAAAAALARKEGFPPHAILFLDIEEGGRLLPTQSDYTFGWTEAVAKAGYRPGAYCSGQPVDEGNGVKITTAQDIRNTAEKQHYHHVTLWVAQDSCGPSPGCVSTKAPKVELSGTPFAEVWQFAQSPRRKEITSACAKTYAPDNSCYAPEMPGIHIDLDVSNEADPSHGR